MAILNPSMDIILKLRQKPTEGELCLLNFLEKTLDNTYELYFQPFLNGDSPDIVVMRKNSGVYIIEVKDWNLDLYRLTQNNHWQVNTKKENWQDIYSPIDQVKRYKDNLFNLHIDNLLEKRIKNPKLLSFVNCGIYFHNAKESYCNSFIKNPCVDKNEKYHKFISYYDFLGYDSLEENTFKNLMEIRRMTRKSYYFDDDIYNSFKRHLKPPIHTIEQGIDIKYSEEQKKIINSFEGSEQKAKGVAGSGKTLCLAKRAVNAHKRHNDAVLILTFNIALRTYIHDKINEVREQFEWEKFHIIHYHDFMKAQARKHNREIKDLSVWNDVNFFKGLENQIYKYRTIIIDEIQDYQQVWIKILLKYFLIEGGEYVVFGDEKQNIYNRIYNLQEKKPYTKIGGQWNLLKHSYRVTNTIVHLAESFQKEFFKDKYELDEISIQGDLFEQSELRYYFLEDLDYDLIIKIYKSISIDFSIHENDMCFQSSNVDILRELDYIIRHNYSQKTNTMFETKEIWDKFKEDYGYKTDLFRNKIEEVRKSKKFNFWNNKGYLKMSTIHSFKGREVDTMFLIVLSKRDEKDKFVTDELIYTALTRCRTNLIVINVNNEKYHTFFKNNIGISEFVMV